jgi:prophage antirepressor-like protein
MEIVKAFNANELTTNILIKGDYENPLFRASDIGDILDIACVRSSTRDFDDSEITVHTMHTLGGQQQVLFLTEFGLYKLLFKSRKPIAIKFQKWVCEVIKEIRLNGEYKYKKENEELKNQMEEKEKENYLSNHNKFLELSENKKVVYIILLKIINENDEKKYIIKIGKTEDLKRRIREISAEYVVTTPVIIDMYESNEITDFETTIKNHNFVKNYRYEYLTRYNKIATEIYCVNENSLKDLKIIIKDIQYNLINNDLNNQIKLQELKLRDSEVKLKILELSKELKENKIDINTENIQNEIIDEIESDIDGVVVENRIKPRNVKMSNTVPEVYQYNPDNLTTHIKKYNSPVELSRENTNIALNSLRLAIKNNTIYKGFRWLYVKRGELPPVNLEPTKDTVIKSHATDVYLARLNTTKTKIEKVYASSVEAIEDIERMTNKKTTCHSFNRAIKTGGSQFGYCWNHFDKCPQDLQDDFLRHSSLPSKSVHPLGKQIFKICPNTNEIIETFNSKVNAANKLGISTKTLNRLMDTDEIYQGYKWSLNC